MPIIHLEFNVSRESLLKAIEQLGPMELDQLVSEVLALQRVAPPLRCNLGS